MFAVAYLRNEQDIDLREFGVKFDVYYLESSLYADGKVEAVVKALKDSGKTYEKDGALWLRTTDYGDDKDRVVRKSDGTYTYFVPDVAYHLTKWKRGFARWSTCRARTTSAPPRACAPACRRWARAFPRATRLRDAQHGARDARRRGGEDLQARRLVRHAARPARLGGARRGAFFLLSRRADADFVFDIDLARRPRRTRSTTCNTRTHASAACLINGVEMLKHCAAPICRP